MEFRVSSQPVDDPFVIPAALSSSYRRLEHDRLPPAHQHRFVAMVEYPAGMLTFHELAEVSDGDAAAGEALMAIADEQGKTVRYRTVAKQFEDTVNWFVAYGSTEVWSVLNLTEDTHPFHVHLVQFQALSRDLYNKDGFDPATGGTRHPSAFKRMGRSMRTNWAGKILCVSTLVRWSLSRQPLMASQAATCTIVISLSTRTMT